MRSDSALERRELRFSLQGQRGRAACRKGLVRLADGDWAARLAYAPVGVVEVRVPAELVERLGDAELLAKVAELARERLAQVDAALDEAEESTLEPAELLGVELEVEL